MAKSKQRREAIARKQARKRAGMDRPKKRSNYARKVAFLTSHSELIDGERVVPWGSDYPGKPWRS